MAVKKQAIQGEKISKYRPTGSNILCEILQIDPVKDEKKVIILSADGKESKDDLIFDRHALQAKIIKLSGYYDKEGNNLDGFKEGDLVTYKGVAIKDDMIIKMEGKENMVILPYGAITGIINLWWLLMGLGGVNASPYLFKE